MAALTFRQATLDDAPRLRELMEHAFSTYDSRPDWTGSAEIAANFKVSLENMQKSLSKPDLVAFVASDDKDYIVATVEVAKRGDDTARISTLIVQDEYQRGGVGRRVLAYGEDWCKENWGVTKFSLNALSNRTALLAWYKRRGYKETGEKEPFPRHAKMWEGVNIPEDLCFVDFIKEVEAAESQ